MKMLSNVCAVSAGMLIAGCAGPLDPLPGIGPGLDQFAGIAMLAVLVALAWRSIQKVMGSRIDNLSPIDILRKRYAEGDLSEEEYQRMMENLSRLKVNSA
jgi:Short C-terminal domain